MREIIIDNKIENHFNPLIKYVLMKMLISNSQKYYRKVYKVCFMTFFEFQSCFKFCCDCDDRKE